jgi:hypothetical protein
MTSGKQRRNQIKRKRGLRAVKEASDESIANRSHITAEIVVNSAALKPNNSYGCPDFVERGYYVDKPFVCESCGADQIWTATQQKWWYEVAKGDVYTTAKKLCRPCRRKERERRAKARQVHLEGLARKAENHAGQKQAESHRDAAR